MTVLREWTRTEFELKVIGALNQALSLLAPGSVWALWGHMEIWRETLILSGWAKGGGKNSCRLFHAQSELEKEIVRGERTFGAAQIFSFAREVVLSPRLAVPLNRDELRSPQELPDQLQNNQRKKLWKTAKEKFK